MLRPGIAALALVSPNNPTGAIYPAGLLSEIYALCRDNGTWLILDETYRDFMADANEPPHRLFDEADWPSHLIQLYSFSKSFCIKLCTWRNGSTLAPFYDQRTKTLIGKQASLKLRR